jgi:hypothetical protein
MNKISIWTLGILIILVSCKKEKFPENDDLQGTWIEQTNNSIKNKLIFEQGTLYFVKGNGVDTLSYRLDKKQESVFLSLKRNPSSGESNHRITQNRKSKTLTILGLYASIPEKTTKTIFKKE